MKRSRVDPYSGPTTLVLDVSAHNGAIDWPRVARSEAMLDGRSQGPVRGVVVRLTDGVQTRASSPCDPMAVRNITGAHEAGLPVAGYLYLRGWHPGAEQAEVALEAVRVAGVPVPWVAIDVEGRPDDPRTPRDEADGAWWHPKGADRPSTGQVLSSVHGAAAHLEAAGVRVVIYAGVAWHWYVSQPGLAPPECRWPLWVPDYTHGSAPRLPVDALGRAAPWPSWVLWQYASTALVAGVPGPCDLSRFRGDEDALRAWWTARG